MTANPIGLVVLAIALLVGGLIIAYKKSSTFRGIVTGALHAVGAAATWMWNNAFQPALRFIVKGLALVIHFFAKVVGAIAKIPGPQQAAMKAVARSLDSAANHVNDFANKIRKIPPAHRTKISADTGAARGAVNAFIAGLPQNKVIRLAAKVAVSAVVVGGTKPGHRAMGGPVVGGRAYIVGERRPELFIPPPGGGRIAPRVPKGGGGGDTFNIYDRSGDPRRTAAEVSRRQAFAGAH